jgi:uncharacterized caspase-like protein
MNEPMKRKKIRLAFLGLVLWSSACTVHTSRRPVVSNPATGLEVSVITAEYGPHDHPIQVSPTLVSKALLNSGYFLRTDTEPITIPIATELGRLQPDEELLLRRSGADYYLFVRSGSVHILRFRGEVKTGHSEYAFKTSATPAIQVERQEDITRPVGPPSPPEKQAAASAVPRIWTVAVGISNYQESSISLTYAHRDAASIDAFFASNKGGSVPKERRVLLTNEQASRASILLALTSISRRVALDDLLVVYLAMHGLPDDGGELYFIAYDTKPGNLVGTGLPQRDIEYALVHSQAERLVMMVDACHAGGAGLDRYTKNRRSLRLAETNRLLAHLANSKPGLAVFTASTATESSHEGSQWGQGHGVFTHYLLKGLNGEAKQQDGVITIRSLFDFVYNNVSESTEGRQHPELKGVFDNNLPLALSDAIRSNR